jgi:hypothetical protein
LFIVAFLGAIVTIKQFSPTILLAGGNWISILSSIEELSLWGNPNYSTLSSKQTSKIDLHLKIYLLSTPYNQVDLPEKNHITTINGG